jgi:tRNA dimethylallyltransferase
MQMYDRLRIISARPTEAELAQAEHVLYGTWSAMFHGSAQAWVEDAARAVRAAWNEGKRPLIVGGTGMYIRGLMEGFSPVPPVDDAVREHVRLLEEVEGTQGVRAALLREDAAMASMLKVGDTQRMMRALEVVRATGTSLSVWQQQKGVPPLPEAHFTTYVILPERQALYARINARFEAMMEAGALEEARSVMEVPRYLPMMQSHGLPELLAYIEGTMGLEEAVERAQQHTRNYAKRQMTWIRNQCAGALDARELC